MLKSGDGETKRKATITKIHKNTGIKVQFEDGTESGQIRKNQWKARLSKQLPRERDEEEREPGNVQEPRRKSEQRESVSQQVLEAEEIAGRKKAAEREQEPEERQGAEQGSEDGVAKPLF